MPDDVATLVIEELQTNNGFQLACYQPRFIVDQVVAACKYEGVPPTLSRARVGIALDNLYVRAAPATGVRPSLKGADAAENRMASAA